ncbi:MAG: hypothetical protein KF683_12180 [Rubrivivax sp.]|nr:hypothetical protein [Rubrivivax sp.]
MARFDDVVDRRRVTSTCLDRAVGALIRSAGLKGDWPAAELMRVLEAALPEALDAPLPDAFRGAAAAQGRAAAEVDIDAAGGRRVSVRVLVKVDVARRAGSVSSARRVDWRLWLGPAGSFPGAWQEVARGSRWMRGMEPG